jgi:N utilization substance protein A
VKGEKVKIKGFLEDFALTRQEADNLIMTARDIVFRD